LAGQRVYPRKLINAGFNFKYPELKKTLESIEFERKNYELI
jgi:NAD dependent epimerase/dehydratase family enzyme